MYITALYLTYWKILKTGSHFISLVPFHMLDMVIANFDSQSQQDSPNELISEQSVYFVQMWFCLRGLMKLTPVDWKFATSPIRCRWLTRLAQKHLILQNARCVQYLCDAMCKHGLCCRPMSVCLSVILVDCIQMAEDINQASCFLTPAPIPNSKGNPFSGDAKYNGVGKFCDDGNLRLSRKWHEIGPWLLWNINRKSYALYRMVTFSMTFTDP